MRIMLIIMADLFVIVTAIVAAYEYFGLKRFKSFTEPYTDKMIRLGIIAKDKREGLLQEDRIGHCIGIALSVICAAMLCLFMAKTSGAVVFIVAEALMLFTLHPDMEETPATRNGYFKAHRNIMDIRKYHEFLVSVGDVSDTDINGNPPTDVL